MFPGRDIMRDMQIGCFPTIEKYIAHVHTVDGVPLKVSTDLQIENKSMFKNLLGLKKRGTDLFFTDIDKIKEQMLKELNSEPVSSK